MVAGLLIAAGILLVIAQLIRVYIVLVSWQLSGTLGMGPLLGIMLGLGAGGLTSYIGWRVGRAG